MSKEQPHIGYKIESRADLEALFNEHYSDLCAYANNFLKDIDASEEVVQDVLFKLWVNRENITFTTSAKSYLFRSVRNACYNVLKHIDIRDEYKAYNEARINEAELSSEDEMMVSELKDKIRRAIDQLPVQRRKIFIMSRYDGLKYHEIAKKLNISAKTVENQMVKALKYLRQELKDYLPLIVLFFENLLRGIH